MYCSHSKKRRHLPYSCFTEKELLVFADVLNIPSNDLLWKNIDSKLHCEGKEGCWLDNEYVRRQIKKTHPDLYETIYHFALKPKGTKNRTDWMTTKEIDEVMKQFETDEFKFVGCMPSDYFLINKNEIPTILNNTKKYSAIVFNLDETDEVGSHWVAMFFTNDDDDNITIEYFDSIGDPMIDNFKKLISSDFFRKKNIVLKVNTKKHQYGDNECGIYAMYYIISRINGETPEYINSKTISDDEMNRYRDVLFRPFTMKRSENIDRTRE